MNWHCGYQCVYLKVETDLAQTQDVAARCEAARFPLTSRVRGIYL